VEVKILDSLRKKVSINWAKIIIVCETYAC
jgi:hypothetical protein